MAEVWSGLGSGWAVVHRPFGLVLAIVVTVHVLLRKREVTTAVGWIGLAWFAPVSGAVAYALLGINRVRQRAQQLRANAETVRGARPHRPRSGDDDGHLDGLRRGVGQLSGRELLDGNTLHVLHNGDEAYPPMLAAIRDARESVGLSSYILRNDKWGGRFIEALCAAHGRGVAVRVLIDGVGGEWLTSPAFHRLRRNGVPAARFMHSLLPWSMPFLNLRSHKKILVIDGRIGFTGGLNIGDENVLAERPRHPVQDTHFRVEGPVVRQLQDAFVEDWAFVTRERLDGARWYPPLGDAGPSQARMVDSGPDEDIEKIEFAILQSIACARGEIAIMSPYFLPDERLIAALALASMRGVAVQIVIPAHSNKAVVDWATRANVGPLLKEGVRIWRGPPPFRHSKLMVVDREWCLIGSCNWDVRSFRLNFELCLEVYDRDLAGELLALMQDSRGDALTAEQLARRPIAVQLRDAASRLLSPYL